MKIRFPAPTPLPASSATKRRSQSRKRYPRHPHYPSTILPALVSTSCSGDDSVKAKLSKERVHGDPLPAAFVEIPINNTLDSAEPYAVVFR